MTSEPESGSLDFRWVLNSGASEHMVSDKSYLVNVRPLNTPITINVAKSGVSLTSHVVGEVEMFTTVGSKKRSCTVHNVLFVPGLYSNLFSAKRIAELGMEVTFGRDGARFVKQSEVLCTASRRGRLYELDVELKQPESAMAGKMENELSLWHRRYGHIGNTNLLKLIRSDMVEGIDVDKSVKLESEICGSCMVDRQIRLPYDETISPRSSRPLELIHTDVCGPFTPGSYDGQKIFVTFIDDYTHFITAV